LGVHIEGVKEVNPGIFPLCGAMLGMGVGTILGIGFSLDEPPMRRDAYEAARELDTLIAKYTPISS
jgi:hypothetical protein